MKVWGGTANDFELLHDYLKIIQTSEAVKFFIFLYKNSYIIEI